ncbi:hypothetical protein ACKE5C_19360 (plasmid) [Aneurinibacillus thermoaerophilus]|uniref:Uncharacterized protein n=1 Tax=Aneurinibacillus thermoaerophilus TaxID=143495 RepID=A0ABX8YGW1_ANETH|nr:hypothetical protein [Aneurinibacillus thermoaerophilus]QYY44737.1 hypothetical protein K3F53_19020 [Aneurinibacillus thermoaerophilus]
MMDLNKLVNDSLGKIQAEGFVEQVVEEQLKKTIKSIVHDVLREYSDFGKNLKKQVESQLNINLDKLNIASYNLMVLNAVKEKLDEAMYLQGIEKIKADMDEILGTSKNEYKLSELIEKLKNDALEYEDDLRGEEMSFHIEPGSSLTFISFDKEPDKHRYECKYRISVDKEGKLISVKIGGMEFKNNVIMGGLYGIEATLFKMYTQGSKLIIDEDEVDTYYPEEWED